MALDANRGDPTKSKLENKKSLATRVPLFHMLMEIKAIPLKKLYLWSQAFICTFAVMSKFNNFTFETHYKFHTEITWDKRDLLSILLVFYLHKSKHCEES